MALPSCVIGEYKTHGHDFLILRDDKGAVLGGIDNTGAGYGSMLGGGGLIPPSTKILFVDGNRVDSYVPDGSLLKPFKAIMDAVNQIIANGDNASNVYAVCIAPKTYAETIVLENPALVNVVFQGLGVAVVSGGLQSQANNSNLSQVDFRGLNLTGGNIVLSGSGGFLANGANFYDLFINITQWTQTSAFSQLFDASLSGNVSFTGAVMTVMGNRGLTTGGTVSLASAGRLTVQRGSRSGMNVVIDATSTYNLGNGARQDGTVTVNGAFNNRLGSCDGAITVNTGGTYTELGGFHTGTLTLNGGTYTQTGVLGAQSLQVGGIHVSAGSGAPNGVVTGNPGDIYVNIAGGALTTLWVKETGVLTNLGWIGK